jgi:Fe2+ transport system protein FeoA/uncharacterized protein YukE
MATLEERIQNLTQDINPMGAMSDMDRKIAMNAMPRQQSAAIMDMVGKTNAAISNREMEMFRNDMPTNSLAPSVSTLNQKRLEQAFKEIQSLAGVLTNKEQDMLSQANDPITLLTTLRDIKQNLRSSGRLMSDTDKEIAMNAMPSNPMQPLVEMGFGEQVDIILGNPADSDISRQAQQQIINEMGTGMDIDSFLMEVNNLAPKGAMTNIDAEGINQLMRFAVKQKVDESNNPLLQLGVETGRMNDTTLGHLSEGEAVIPAEVLEANPQAAQSLDQTMTEMGINPDSRIVDTTGQINGIASINPETGLQEFGIGSSFQKFRRKVLKPVAKIAAVVPGPWQAPAIIYNKLESGYNIASGKGGIGDLMTVMAGGTQKVGGEGGAWDRIKSGDFAKEGGGTGFFDSAGKALKNIITLLTTLRDIKQNLRSSGRLMSDTDKEIAMNAMPSNPMQPLVEMGFGEQVDIILGNPADSDISRQAQQQIINEMGTGMDIDSFLMEVNNLAPKGAMTNIDAEGINQLMRFAVKQKVDESNNPLLQLGVETGRMNDTTLGHLSEGEAVIPAEVLEANPQAAQSLDQTMTEMGINPDSRIVDTTGQINGIASINPETGLQEFGIGSSFQKFRRKVLKPVAKIAAVVPGPWQAPAIIYNKLESGYNIASGKGGIGDLMTVMAGGTQKVGGEGGAWDRIKSGDFAKEGGGTGFFDSAGKALKNIGSVDGKFNPLQYGKNIASTYRDDQVGGYFGLLAGGEQPLPEEIQAIDNYETGEVEYVNTRTGQTLSAAEVKQLTSGGTNPFIKSIGEENWSWWKKWLRRCLWHRHRHTSR